jgi:hypothetical protein
VVHVAPPQPQLKYGDETKKIIPMRKGMMKVHRNLSLIDQDIIAETK